jgi:hypothetical protein
VLIGRVVNSGRGVVFGVGVGVGVARWGRRCVFGGVFGGSVCGLWWPVRGGDLSCVARSGVLCVLARFGGVVALRAF